MRLCTPAIVAAAAVAGVCAAQDTLYVVDSVFSPTLLELDIQTGEVLSSVEIDAPDVLTGGLTNDGGTLYSIVGAQDLEPDVLVTIDPATGAVTPVGELGGDWMENSIDVNPVDGRMWLVGDNELHEVDAATGESTLVAPLAGGSITVATGIAIDHLGRAYTTDLDGEMFELDLETGETSLLWDPGLGGDWYEGLGFGSVGLLWGTRFFGGVSILDVDEQTDVVVFDGTYPGITLVPSSCPGDCNADGALSVLDFVCFQQAWQGRTPAGDCDGNGAYDVLDFVCFQGLFADGCG